MIIDPDLSFTIKIEKSSDQSFLLIDLKGKITSENIFSLNNKIKNIFEEKIYDCIFRLQDLKYINSSGIALLLNIHKAIEKNDGHLILLSPSKFITDLLEIADLKLKFEIVSSLEEAKKRIQKSL